MRIGLREQPVIQLSFDQQLVALVFENANRDVLFTKDCKRPIFVVTTLQACESPGVIELQIDEVNSAPSVAAIADGHTRCFVKISDDSDAVINERRHSTTVRRVAPAERCFVGG